MGEKVFFTGLSDTFASGNKVVHGQQGEVVGPATLESHKGKGVKVLFPGNTLNIECYLTEVRRPPLRLCCPHPPPPAPRTRDAVATAPAPAPPLRRPLPTAPHPRGKRSLRARAADPAWCRRQPSSPPARLVGVCR